MSQAPITFPGELPASLRCGFCQKPIDSVFYRTMKRFACSKCVREAEEISRRNQFDAKSFSIAAIAGFAVALLCAIGWAAIVKITHWQIGIVAIFIGAGVGKTVRAASGKRRGKSLQWLSAILAGVSVALGKIGYFFLMLVDAAHAEQMEITSPTFFKAFFNVLLSKPQEIFNAIDLVWIGLAAFGAWRICTPMKVAVAGPYTYQPQAMANSLQFDTAEPADSSAPIDPSRPA